MSARSTGGPSADGDGALDALRRALPEPDEDDLVEDRPSDEPSEEDHGPLHNPWWVPL